MDINEKMLTEEHSISSAKDEVLIENKQKQIVQGACKLFFAKGYHPTTIREIAEACDMSMGQLYHYISSKDDVLFLVHKHFHEIMHRFVQNYEINQKDDPVETFINFLKANLIFINEHKELIQFILTETKYLKKDYLKLVLEMEKTYTIDFYYQLLADINKKAPIKGDLNVLASIIAHVTPFLAMRGWTVKDKSLDEMNKYLLDFMLKGLGLPVPQETGEK
jgi:AcrR family transcriptional regulator